MHQGRSPPDDTVHRSNPTRQRLVRKATMMATATLQARHVSVGSRVKHHTRVWSPLVDVPCTHHVIFARASDVRGWIPSPKGKKESKGAKLFGGRFPRSAATPGFHPLLPISSSLLPFFLLLRLIEKMGSGSSRLKPGPPGPRAESRGRLGLASFLCGGGAASSSSASAEVSVQAKI